MAQTFGLKVQAGERECCPESQRRLKMLVPHSKMLAHYLNGLSNLGQT
jgi:hypothetical protein